jgi:putative tryptophan/tyrosine transport system substrate-binding protein
MMRRREFIAGLGSAAAWPTVARAQQSGRMRQIGVLVGSAERDPVIQSRMSAFQQALLQLGWSDGRNVQINWRWGAGNGDRIRAHAAELVGLKPDLIFAANTPVVAALRQETSTIPIVFVTVDDPVASGFVESLARPGGNITGFTNYLDTSIAGKWVELLKEIAPGVKRVSVMYNPETAPARGTDYLRHIQTAATSSAIEATSAPVHNEAEIESAIIALSDKPGSGLIVMADIFNTVHRGRTISLAARYRVPAIYALRFFVAEGGLMSYGIDTQEQFRRAAGYVDRVLKGEKPRDLPVQGSTRYEFVINLKTAKALGLEVPAKLLTIADEAIE